MEPNGTPSFAILYVDDESNSLKYFREIMEDIAPVYTAKNAEEGLRVFSEHRDEIGVVLSDQKMPGRTGLEFLEEVRRLEPRPLRILVTAFADLSRAVGALNEGLLYSYLTKPWDPEELEKHLSAALEHFSLVFERDRLLHEKSVAFQHLMMADKAARIGILSSGLNHHMRNALTVIRGFHELLPFQLEEELGRPPKDDEFWREHYREVGEQIQKMTSILGNLWESANSSDLDYAPGVDLPDIVEGAATMVLGDREGVAFSLVCEEEIPAMTGDQQKLNHMARMLFHEVAVNVKGEGTVHVTIGMERDSMTGRESIRVRCEDDGDPISEGDTNRLFDPFFVREDKPDELGTNLMACYLTVFFHGGSIEAERTDAGRNVIRFTLPVQPSETGDADTARRLLDDAARMEMPDRAELPA